MQGKILPPAVLFVLVVSCVALGGSYVSSHKADIQYTEVFEGALLHEVVFLDGDVYEVVGGVVRREDGAEAAGELRKRALAVAHEKTMARRHPLLSIPGTDPNSFSVALDKLEALQTSYADKQRDEATAAYVRSALYPLAYLDALAGAERSRERFLTTGSEADAALYARDLRTLVRRYASALDAFEEAFEGTVPEDIRDYAVPSKILSRAGTLEAIDSLRKSIQRTESEILRRSTCVHASPRACRPADLRLPTVEVPDMDSPSTRQLDIARTIVDVLPKVPFFLDTALGTRLIQLSESACVARDSEGAKLFLIRRMWPGTADERLSATYVGNWYMLHVKPGSSFAELPYLEGFAKEGVEYVPMHPLIYYECPDSDRDLGRIYAIRDVAIFAKESPISAFASGEEAERIAALERTLSSARIITEADAASYLNAALPVLRDPHVPGSVKGPLSQLILEYAYRAEGLLGALQSIATAEHANVGLSERGERMDFSALNLFYARSALPALFLAGNASLNNREELYAPNELASGEQPYVLLSEISDDTYKMGQILLGSLRFYNRLYERM